VAHHSNYPSPRNSELFAFCRLSTRSLRQLQWATGSVSSKEEKHRPCLRIRPTLISGCERKQGVYYSPQRYLLFKLPNDLHIMVSAHEVSFNKRPYFGTTGMQLNIWVTIACTTAMTLFGALLLPTRPSLSHTALTVHQATTRACLEASLSLRISLKPWAIQTRTSREQLSPYMTLAGML